MRKGAENIHPAGGGTDHGTSAADEKMDGVQGDRLTYVLITPARNEEDFIEQTIKSVVAQTLLPKKWVIVSDGSTDGTDDIVARYATEHRWISLLRMPEERDRSFAAKVHCFNAGLKKVKRLKFDVIGSLDADISFEEDYFEFLMQRFETNPELGVAGTPFTEEGRHYDYRFTSIEHVSGACQLFRRECFDEIGGYVPIKGGGIDWTAVTTARMKGWRTRTYMERTCLHHRPIGTALSSSLLSRFRFGVQDYYLGGHPLWELFRSIYQMKNRPYVAGGLMLLSGYCWALLKRTERPIPQELVRFRRKEQMHRLKKLFHFHG